MAEKGGSRTLRGPYGPQTGFEDQRHHRAPSFSEKGFDGSIPVMAHQDLLRELPSVDELLSHQRSAPLIARFNRTFLTKQCRAVLDELRNAIRDGALVSARDLDDDTILSWNERSNRRISRRSAA
jgi:hypothetical protein